MTDCPFCEVDPARLIEQSSLTRTIADGFPVSPGHLLVTPRRHVSDFFALTSEERTAIMEALSRARHSIAHADGFNVGINNGQAAGQTVMHVHVHLIPRYRGDVADPRGGVRWVIPDKAAYWSTE